MDFWDILVFLVLVFAIVAIGAVYLYKVIKKPTTVPGPEFDSYLEGHMPDIIACGSLHEFLCKAHKQYGPIISVWLGPKMFISLGSAELFAQQANVFDRSCELFASFSPLIGTTSIQVTNGSEGRRRHAMYSKCFTPSAIRRYYDVYNQLAEKVVDKWLKTPQDEQIPLMKHMFDFTIHAILAAVYGCDDHHRISSVHDSYKICFAEMDRQFKGDFIEPGSDRDKLFLQHRDNLRQLMLDVVARHRAKLTAENQHSESDVTDATMIDATLTLKLPEDTMIIDLLTVFIGGFHTSASLLTWAVYCLAVNPAIQAAAREEVKRVCSQTGDVTADDVDNMTYMAQILNETLRWAIVGPYAARAQDKDIVIAGHHIPAGTGVIQALGVAMHDPEIFPQPDKFDPDRFAADRMQQLPEYAFEPFGFAGKRKCPGYRFSLAEVSVLLARLLRSGLQFSLAPGQTVTAKFDITGKPSDEVWITVEQKH